MTYYVIFTIFVPGEPARTVGWRDPGFIHTAFMRGLWPNKEYVRRSMQKCRNLPKNVHGFKTSLYVVIQVLVQDRA